MRIVQVKLSQPWNSEAHGNIPALQSKSSSPSSSLLCVSLVKGILLWSERCIDDEGERGLWLCAWVTNPQASSSPKILMLKQTRACWIRINRNYRSICIFVNRITQKCVRESETEGDVVSPPSLSLSLSLTRCVKRSALCIANAIRIFNAESYYVRSESSSSDADENR